MEHFQGQPMRFSRTFSYEPECFFGPWMSLWDDMRKQTEVLKRRFADKTDAQNRQLQDDIANLAAWMEKTETNHKIAKTTRQWIEMLFDGDMTARRANGLLSYYRDLWKLVRCGENSVDAAYRCIDYVREFPQRISWDMDELQKKYGLAKQKDDWRYVDVRVCLAMPSGLKKPVYSVYHMHDTSPDVESGLVA